MPTDAFGNEISQPSSGGSLPGMPSGDGATAITPRATTTAPASDGPAPPPRPTKFATPIPRSARRGRSAGIIVLLAVLAAGGAGVSALVRSVGDHVSTLTRSFPAFTTPHFTVPTTPPVTVPASGTTPPGAARRVQLLAPSGLRRALAIAGRKDGARTTVVLVRVDAGNVYVFARKASGARVLASVDATLTANVAASGFATRPGVPYGAVDVQAVQRMRKSAGLTRSRVEYAAMTVDPIDHSQIWSLVSRARDGGSQHQWTADAHGRGLRKLS